MAYNQYDSDYQVRLATLGALGGDTGKTYDSTYDVDIAILEAIEQGGGGEGLNYNQIKALLAASGVTEILVNGDGESITLDYDLLSQIGQGGGSGDYKCVDSVDALSGITSPKDGAMAYVAGKGLWKYYAATAITKWLEFDVDLDALNADEIDTMIKNYVSNTQELTIRSKYIFGTQITARVHRFFPDPEGVAPLDPSQTAPYTYEIIFYGVIPEYLSTSNHFVTSDEFGKIIVNQAIVYFRLNSDTNKWELIYRGYHITNSMSIGDVTSKLAQTGVTSVLIKENSGATTGITLDYALASQIGQGGGDSNYFIVNSLDELSGVTAEDGMLAYVKEYTGSTSATTVVVDAYNIDNWLVVEADYGNDVYGRFSIHRDGGVCVSYNIVGHFVYNNDGWIGNVIDNLDKLPADFIFDNGVTGTYVSRVSGDTYEQNGDWKDTIYFYPYSGIQPTISVYAAEGNADIVSSGSTSGTITITIGAKGFYKYYDDIQSWQPYNINWDSFSDTEKIDIINQFATNKKPLKVQRNVNDWGLSVREFYAVAYCSDWEHPSFVNGVSFYANVVSTPSAEIKVPSFGYSWDSEQQKWNTDSANVSSQQLERSGAGYTAIRQWAVQIPQANNEYFANPGTIYNIPISGVVSGTVYQTYFQNDPTDHTWDENCFKFYNGWSGFDCWFSIRKDGYLRAECGSRLVIPIQANNTANTYEWTICNYTWQDEANNNNGAYAVAAVRMYEIANDNYRIEMFVSKAQDGYQDQYSTDFNQEKSYTWTETSGQTMEIQPMIYSYGVVDKTPRVYKFKLQ